MCVGLDPSYQPAAAPQSEPQQPANLSLVPRIAQPLNAEKQITAPAVAPGTRLEKIGSVASNIAKSHSNPGNAEGAYGRKVMNKGVKKYEEGSQQVEQAATSYWVKMVNSPIGGVFRQSFQRATKLVVLGSPYSRFSLICNAVTALTNLAVFSLTQDSLGRFHEGVPEIVRVFTTAITKLDAYMASTPIPSSDHDTLRKPAAEQRKVAEIDEVRECLREGLEKILGNFNEFLGGMGMSRVDILDAKKIVGQKGAEMAQVSN